MKKSKLNLINDNLIWNASRRYKINSVVQYNGVDYQNITGLNSVPDLLIDWQTSSAGVSDLNGLSDVTITGTTANKILASTTEGLWENKTLKTINGSSILGSGDIPVGDMTLGTAQTVTARKTFNSNNTTAGGIGILNNKTTSTTYGDSAGLFIEGSGSYGILVHSGCQFGIRAIAPNAGTYGIFASAAGVGSYGFYSQNQDANAVGVYSRNESTGVGMRLENLLAATGKPFQYLKFGQEKLFINDAGDFSAQSITVLGTLGLRNVANTFTSLFTNANTAARTYTLQDRNLTVAGLDDIGLVALDEGNGIGYVIGGRVAANYGNIGLGAVDLGYSDSASSTRGATGARAVVSGGIRNTASNTLATVGGGADNTASGQYSTVGGGYLNTASGLESTVAGGDSNTASGNYSNVVGGSANLASGLSSSISGGEFNRARSYGEWVGGVFGTDYTPTSTTVWQALDRIFNIGNGTASVRADAFTILKNGLATLPSVTNALITAEATGKAVVTKEYISNVQRNVIKNTTTSTPVTGTVSQTILFSQLIPANTFQNGDFFNIILSRVGKTGTAGTLTQTVRINTTNTLTGATTIALNTGTTANLNHNIGRRYSIEGGSLKGLGTGSAQSDMINSSADITSYTFNPAIDNYIFVVGQLSNASDSMFHSSFLLTN